jgi:hypothetical protein
LSFQDSFALPFTRHVNGKDYTLKLLTTSDYIPWMGELTTQRRKDFKAEIPEMVDPVSRYNIQRAIVLHEVTPDSLVELIATGEGTIRVLKLLGKKAGVPDGEMEEFVNGGSPQQNLRDAYRGSALMSTEQYLTYFPDELPPEDTLVVLLRLAKMSPQTRLKIANIIADANASPAKLQSEMAAIVGLPESPAQEKPDPNPQSPA